MSSSSAATERNFGSHTNRNTHKYTLSHSHTHVCSISTCVGISISAQVLRAHELKYEICCYLFVCIFLNNSHCPPTRRVGVK